MYTIKKTQNKTHYRQSLFNEGLFALQIHPNWLIEDFDKGDPT